MFAEPNAMGMKVGDNWCVPLCHSCHMKLHHFGDERTWWDLQGVDAKEWAKLNWEKFNDYEKEDNTKASQELACTAGVCEVVDI